MQKPVGVDDAASASTRAPDLPESAIPRPRGSARDPGGGRVGRPGSARLPLPGALRRPAAAWGLGLAALCAVLVRVSLTVGIDSDGANKALQGWDLLHGHPLLHGWITGDATFYGLETPVYGLVETVVGLNPTAMHIEAGLVYTLVSALVLVAGRGTATGWAAAVRYATAGMIMLVPLASVYGVNLLVEQPDHIGTAAFLLGLFLLVGRADRLRPGTAAAGVLGIAVLGILSDDTVTYVGVPAVAAVAALELRAGRARRTHAAILAADLLAFPAERLVRVLMHLLDGYWMTRPTTRIAGPGAWPSHLHRTLRALGALYGVLFDSSPVFAALGAAALGLAAIGLARALIHWRRVSRVEALCALGLLLNLGVYTVSTGSTPIPAHEVAAALPLGAVLAARCVSPAWAWWRPAARRVCAVLAVAALAAPAVALTRPASRPIPLAPAPTLATWLRAHGLRDGIAGYWDASTLTVDSGGAVAVRAVVRAKHGFTMYAWEARTDWYLPDRAVAQFAVAYDGPDTFGLISSDRIGTASFEAFLGAPAQVYHVDGRTVLVYRANLFDRVADHLPPRAKRQ